MPAALRSARHRDWSGEDGVRALTALLFLAGAGLILWASSPLRTMELIVAGKVMRVGAGHTVVYRPSRLIFFQTNAARMVGLQITASCTAIFLILPFLILGAFMTQLRRVRIHQLLVAVPVAAVWVFALNQVRLMIIAWATHHWGIDLGFDWSHILAGSIVTTLSMLIGLYVFARLSLIDWRRPAGT